MSGTPRLTSLDGLADEALRPGYDPAAHGVGVVHIGVGAFHRAHQAVYTDAALAQAGGDWRIAGVSLRSTGIVDALNAQNGLYALIERGAEGTRGRVIASIASAIAASRDREAVLEALAAAGTRVVTLTVTEKAYGVDRAAMQVDPAHEAVAADLADPRRPVGVLGLLVEGLRLRHAAGRQPFTVLCCDNLPENGAILRAGVVDFARRVDPALADWIAESVAFPSSMVDRITPAATPETLAEAERLTGCVDRAAIETEPFSQWVIEDRFPLGRPAWDAGGAIFVDDVTPYEKMKLRMLNGAHSMLAYAGFLAGHAYVRDVMADEALSALIDRQMRAASGTLPRLDGVDLDQYRRDLLARFANPAIAHETYQIAMDGTEKLPQRLLEPAVETLRKGGDLRPFAFAVAAWMRYCLGRKESGEAYALRDPRETELAAAISNAGSAEAISNALHGVDRLIPAALAQSGPWRAAVAEILQDFLTSGARAAIDLERTRAAG